MKTLKSVCDDLFKEVVFDKALVEKVYKWHIQFMNKGKEYLEFFTGNLIGVHVVRWPVRETQSWFAMIGVDMLDAEKALGEVETINQDFKIRSDALNIAFMYVIHRFSQEAKLDKKTRERAMFDVALTFFYRSLVIKQSNWFSFPADPKIAQAAYARLSNKFLLKQLKSWHKCMEYRANALLHEKRLAILTKFDDDIAITDLIAEGDRAIWGMYVNYNTCFYAAVAENDKIASVSATITDVDGVDKLREKVRHVDSAVNAMLHALHDSRTFIRMDMVAVVLEMNTNTSQRMLLQVLEWISAAYMDTKKHKLIDNFVKMTVVHSYHLVAEMGEGEAANMASTMMTLKNLYLSTRSTDPNLAKIRTLGADIIKQAAGKMNNSLLQATRTAVILYITLRAFSAAK